jgi:hypothetical protein
MFKILLVFINNPTYCFSEGYGLDDRGWIPCGGSDWIFPFLHWVQTKSRVHIASYSIGTGGFYPWTKRPERQTDYSPPPIAEVKNERSYTFTPQYVFIALCLVKHRDNFTLHGLLCTKPSFANFTNNSKKSEATSFEIGIYVSYKMFPFSRKRSNWEN